jgi:hypothetical protein
VTQLVVDPFESVDVEECQHAAAAMPARRAESLFGEQVEAAAIGEPGQFVGDRKPTDVLVGLFQLGVWAGRVAGRATRPGGRSATSL